MQNQNLEFSGITKLKKKLKKKALKASSVIIIRAEIPEEIFHAVWRAFEYYVGQWGAFESKRLKSTGLDNLLFFL